MGVGVGVGVGGVGAAVVQLGGRDAAGDGHGEAGVGVVVGVDDDVGEGGELGHLDVEVADAEALGRVGAEEAGDGGVGGQDLLRHDGALEARGGGVAADLDDADAAVAGRGAAQDGALAAGKEGHLQDVVRVQAVGPGEELLDVGQRLARGEADGGGQAGGVDGVDGRRGGEADVVVGRVQQRLHRVLLGGLGGGGGDGGIGGAEREGVVGRRGGRRDGAGEAEQAARVRARHVLVGDRDGDDALGLGGGCECGWGFGRGGGGGGGGGSGSGGGGLGGVHGYGSGGWRRGGAPRQHDSRHGLRRGHGARTVDEMELERRQLDGNCCGLYLCGRCVVCAVRVSEGE